MTPPLNIDGTQITGASIDGTEVEAITVDGTKVFATGPPASGDLHARYDATALSKTDGTDITTWPDETANGFDLTAGTAPSYKTGAINGLAAVSFDGTETLDVSFTGVAQPYHFFIVASFNNVNTGSNNVFIDDDSGSTNSALFNNAGEYALIAGNKISTGVTPDNTPTLHSALFDGSASNYRIDKSDNTGDGGTSGLDGLTVGSEADSNLNSPIDIGEILIYPQSKSTILSDVENHLIDKWGLTI